MDSKPDGHLPPPLPAHLASPATRAALRVQ